jgi:hypothetical protein
MTPAAKEGLPAVVGELVALAEKWERNASANRSTEFGKGTRAAYESCAEQLRATLSALTAEAGKVNELSGNSGQLPEAGKGEVTDAMVSAAVVLSRSAWRHAARLDDGTEAMDYPASRFRIAARATTGGNGNG